MSKELFSKRASKLVAASENKSFQIENQGEIISFAAGNPPEELFPIKELREATCRVLDEKNKGALQYSVSEGVDELRKVISKRMAKLDINMPYENIIVTCGTQQSLNIIQRVFIDEGDIIACESPTFLGFIQSAKLYTSNFKEIPICEDGIDTFELENVLKTCKIKYLYTIPNYQNPSGVTMSIEKRKKLIELANKYDFVIIEDNPYYELGFDNNIVKPIKSFDTEGRVIFLGSFSKIIAPGLRVGWICGDKKYIEKCNIIKQIEDVHTNVLSQKIIVELLKNYDIESHIKDINKVYKERRDLILDSIKKYFPSSAKYRIPEGGMFLWIELPEGVEAMKILKKSLEKKVLFFIGNAFYVDTVLNNTFRLNYTSMTRENLVKGIKILGEVLKENI